MSSIEDKPARTDRELLVLIYERQKISMSDIKDIKEEVKKTNGRVTALELWKSRLGGMWFVVVIVSGIVGSLIAYAVNHFIK